MVDQAISGNLQQVDRAAYFRHRAILVLDFLHIVRLRTAKKHDGDRQIEPHVQATAAFLSTRQRRNVFVI